MTRKKTDSLCPLCGGRRKPGRTTYSVDLGEGLVVVRNVKAKICTQCGEEWIDNKTAKELERVTEEAREKRHQVEVLAL
jgi:YgiT-type zinc finger domain-containing protein